MAAPPDDPSITDETKVLRRVVPGRYSRTSGIPEEGTFRKDGDGTGTSVTLWLSDEDLNITRAPHPDFGVVSLYVSEFRKLGLSIAYVDEPGNPNHCEVFGDRTKGNRVQLAKAARWVAYPIGYPEELKKQLWTRDDP